MGEEEFEAGRFRRASLLSQLHGMLQSANPMWGTWCLGLLFFEDDVGINMLRDNFGQKMLNMPRYRSKYDFKRDGFVELDRSEIDMEFHVKHVAEKVSLQDVLKDYVGNVYKHFEVDSERPLWQCTYFSNMDDGRSLALINTHHVVGDGVSQVKVLLDLTDGGERGSGVQEGVARVSDDPTIKVKKKKKKKKKKKAKGGSSFGILNKASIAIAGALSAFTAPFVKPDSPSVLMRKDTTTASIQKNIAYTEVIPLAKVKEIAAKYTGSTVNDVLVAVLTMTLRSYLEDEGANDALNKRVRASFPINARKPKEDPFRDGSPHNNLALGTMQFPFKYAARTEVVYKVKRTIDAIKFSPAPFVQRGVGNTLLRVMPRDSAAKLFAGFGNQTTAMLSNVMGPQKAVYVGGHKVVDMQFGLYSSNGIYLGLISYDGKVSCGITMDETLGDPEGIAKHWTSEFNALYEETMAIKGQVPKPKSLRSMIDKM